MSQSIRALAPPRQPVQPLQSTDTPQAPMQSTGGTSELADTAGPPPSFAAPASASFLAPAPLLPPLLPPLLTPPLIPLALTPAAVLGSAPILGPATGPVPSAPSPTPEPIEQNQPNPALEAAELKWRDEYKRCSHFLVPFHSVATAEHANVLRFLDTYAEAREAYLELLGAQREYLEVQRTSDALYDLDYLSLAEAMSLRLRRIVQELATLKRWREQMGQEMEEEMERLKKDNDRELQGKSGIEATRIWCAYEKVAKLVSKPGGGAVPDMVPEDRDRFERKVRRYYNTQEAEGGFVWCHVLGQWVESVKVEIFQIVPCGFSRNELAFLFNVRKVNFRDPKNGITMLSSIGDLLRQGVILLVPMEPNAASLDRWKCMVVDPRKNNEVVYRGPPVGVDGEDAECIQLHQLHNKELVFRSDNRPTAAFIYFRFLVSGLQASWKRYHGMDVMFTGQGPWLRFGRGAHVEKKVTEWLASSFAGCEIGDELLEGNCFVGCMDRDDEHYCTRARMTGMVLAADLLDMTEKQFP
ncbi:hypothetical protein BDW74DRAFT_179370 [Aspergillus multicolor]|uniref:uncharacterized protein n=1 Tax=Aspergillus multicolor TaxID=41759 RepID=UPI003CCE2A82